MKCFFNTHIMKINFVWLLFLLSPLTIPAQNIGSLEYLTLKGNNHLKGKVVNSDSLQNITFQLLTGQTLTFKKEDVLDIRKSSNQFFLHPGDYCFLAKGFYFSFGAFVNIPLSDNILPLIKRQAIPLFPRTFQISGGYRFSNYFSLGISGETDFKNFNYLPVALEIKGSTMDKRTAPLYVFQIGHTFFTGPEGSPALYFKPGDFFFYPSIGIRRASLKSYSTEITVGLRTQLTNLKYKEFNIFPQPDPFPDPETTKIWEVYFTIKLAFTF